MHRGAYAGRSAPDETQLRNVLRRTEGAQQRARHAARLRAEAGYGDQEPADVRLDRRASTRHPNSVTGS
jgi:hypothetical protein